MSEHRIDPPDYRGAALALGISAFIVGLISSWPLGPWLCAVGGVMIVASRKLEDPF